MTKILGLDIGTGSIGWAIIEKQKNSVDILGMGVRVIHATQDEQSVVRDFEKGKPASFNAKRTSQRGIRRNFHRFKLRRKRLNDLLLGMNIHTNRVYLPASNTQAGNYSSLRNHQQDNEQSPRINAALFHWGLRAEAAEHQISLDEFGLVLTHLLKKRGFKSNRKAQDEGEDTQYKERIKELSATLKTQGKTIGQHHFSELLANVHTNLKGRVYYRSDYQEEFEQIWKTQAKYYPELTDELKQEIGQYTLFYQRPLKSAKHLLSRCRYETHLKVCPRSSPLFQEFRIRQTVADIKVSTLKGEEVPLSIEQRRNLYSALQDPTQLNAKGILSHRKIIGALGLKPANAFSANFDEIIGHRTWLGILNAFEGELIPGLDQQGQWKDDMSPLMQIWHILYSIPETQFIRSTLRKRFQLEEHVIENLCELFLENDYSSVSAKAMRQLLPHLENGHDYTKSCEAVGYKHSDSSSMEENTARQLAELAIPLQRNELRSPVAEKILNQVIKLVNEVLKSPKYGRPDEIRIELARELKQNAKQRDKTQRSINRNRALNEDVRKVLRSEFRIPNPSRRDITRYRLWKEQEMQCLYSGKPIGQSQLFSPDVELDHIIPKAKLFNDSSHNLAVVFRAENQDKGDLTAMDYIVSKNEAELNSFQSRIGRLFEAGNSTKNAKEITPGISKAKLEFLKMKEADIPEDFIDRQLRLTQYITREASKRLEPVVRKVTVTSGGITDYLRNSWGVDTLLQELYLEQWPDLQTSQIENRHGERKNLIADWSKRDDQRHHALDAAIVAITSQGMIQRLNRLQQNYDSYKQMKESGYRIAAPDPKFRIKLKKALSEVLVSFNNRRRIATWSKNVIPRGKGKEAILQKQLIPRGFLHKDTIYGRNKRIADKPLKLNAKVGIDQLRNIVDPLVRERAIAYFEYYEKDAKRAFGSKKNAFEIEGKRIDEVEIYETYYTKRVTLGTDFDTKLVKDIIDVRVRELVEGRLAQHGNQSKLAFEDLNSKPLWFDQSKGVQIRRVKIRAKAEGLQAIHQIEGQEKDFVFTRNNYKLIVFINHEDKPDWRVVSFWEAFELMRQNSTLEDLEGVKEILYDLKINDHVLVDFEGDVLHSSYPDLSKHLYRVQKLTDGDVFFRHHLETQIGHKWAEVRITSLSKLLERIRIVQFNILGQHKC